MKDTTCDACAKLRRENERLREFAFGGAPEWERANCTLKHRVRELEGAVRLTYSNIAYAAPEIREEKIRESLRHLRDVV